MTRDAPLEPAMVIPGEVLEDDHSNAIQSTQNRLFSLLPLGVNSKKHAITILPYYVLCGVTNNVESLVSVHVP